MLLNSCLTEQGLRVTRDAFLGEREIVGIDFNADTVSSPFGSRDSSCSAAKKRIENRVSNKAKHPDQAFGELDGIGSRVVFGRSSCNACPNLLEPFPVIVSGNQAEDLGGDIGSAVST